MHPVVGLELEEYRRLDEEIRVTFGNRMSVQLRRTELVRLLDEIETSTLLPESTRWSLESRLGEAALAALASTDRDLYEFLESGDERLERAVIAKWLKQDEPWAAHAGQVGRFEAIVNDERMTLSLRLTLASLLAFENHVSAVEGVLTRWAEDHSDPDLAHEAAWLILGPDLDPCPDARVALSSTIRSVREEAARRLVSDCREADLEPTALAIALSVALDYDEPAETRGEAIRAIACRTSTGRFEALQQLALERNWFFGAAGNHFAIHSLALVVEGLDLYETAAARDTLDELSRRTAALRSGEREYVEWVLGHALGVGQEFFSEPVDPESSRR